MVSRARGRPVSVAADSAAPDAAPTDFRADVLYHEKRSTITLSSEDALARPPLLLDEVGCRVSGSAGGRAFTIVLDDPAPSSLRRAAPALAGALAEPAAITNVSTRERTGRWIDPILRLFERWSREAGAARFPGGIEIAGTRMDAAVSYTSVAVARARGEDPFFVVRDRRAAVEGRLTLTFRNADRLLSVETTRWADPMADPPSSALTGWHDAPAECARRALDLFEAVPPPAMDAPAVFSPAAAGILLHEICGHLLEGDLVAEGDTPFARLGGEKVAYDKLTILDDPRAPGARVRLLADDEGNETRATVLVEAGILRGFLTCDASAPASGGVSTANARRESYRWATLPRMTNLTVAPGEDDPADLVRPVARGLLVERLGRGQVDPRRGEFRLEVEAGRLIEGGRPGRAVAGAFLVGSCRDLLRSIDGVGSDVRTDPGAGACIKEDQVVPIGQATPSLRVAKVRIVPGVVS